jgi:kumamolisin
VDLSIVLAPSHEDQLQRLLSNQYDPSSPEYHHWLGPGQFAEQFGPTSSDVAAVESWLRGDGISSVSSSGFTVDVDSTASRVSSVLGTTLRRYRSPTGTTGYVAQQDPLVPQSLAGGQITSIVGLNTVATPQPLNDPTPSSRANAAIEPHADGITPCSQAETAAGTGYYTLDTEGAAYGIGSLLANGQTGHSETIGLYELGSSSSSDVSTFTTCFGLTNPVSVVSVDGGGGTAGGDPTAEADSDIEQAATQAPDASIVSYEGPDSGTGPYDVWDAIVTADKAQVVSTSWGLCEPFEGAASMASLSTLLEQAASQGQSILTASGDSGSEDCNTTAVPNTNLEVDFPSSDPWVTAVGGTELLSAGNEVAWTDGGGGVSRYVAVPSWQPVDWYWPPTAGNACGQDCREVPDLSANAGVGMVTYFNGAWQVAGGTSLAAPLVAGLVADRNDGCTAPTADFAPALYAAAAQGLYGTGLTDIISGNNDATGTYDGEDYPATVGYDLATGLGSPLAAGLSCAEVDEVGSGSIGSQVTVSGLGLEHSTIDFGGVPAQVVSADATSATVVVPTGSGTVTVSATSDLGAGNQTVLFTYPASPTPPPTPTPTPTPTSTPTPTHGYWLVGGDGGIFSFGSAQFYGSTGNLRLQRPVVGITPTSDDAGYWLDASDGGIFAFGNAGFYGSIPGLGFEPAGSTGPGRKLDAPVVGMVPSADGRGYFMVASDGGVFAFGDARFAGSCPGIGGCVGAAVAVMPDASGNGYWLVTSSGNVYTFGDAPYFGGPGSQGSLVTSAVRTPDGNGYWILFANGTVTGYGDAAKLGGPVGSVGGSDPASAIFSTADGGGYWVSSATGAVFTYGDAAYDGGMSGVPLNAPVIAATGW